MNIDNKEYKTKTVDYNGYKFIIQEKQNNK